MERELVGVLAHGDPRGRAQVGRIDDVDRATGPVRDVEQVAVARQCHVVGPAADRGRLELLLGLEIDRRDGSVVDIERVQQLAQWVQGQPATEMTLAPKCAPLPSPLGSISLRISFAPSSANW